jgi:hypothetical protein
LTKGIVLKSSKKIKKERKGRTGLQEFGKLVLALNHVGILDYAR